MGRIRTIKPEFPQSESMGRISREARLLFVLLWTVVDDSGRTRANSRMLASLLYPYDEDAPRLIGGWLDELEEQECIVRYTYDGSTYAAICNWLNHQKIDRPSKSKLPSPEEGLANPREHSSSTREPSLLDQGPRTKEGTKDQKLSRATRLPGDFQPDDTHRKLAEGNRISLEAELEKFRDYWTAKAGKDATKADWPATFRNWLRNAAERRTGNGFHLSPPVEPRRIQSVTR